jgi:gamma-glutamyl-gamma-aminobutyrate hydrolase PuuD
MKVYILTAMHNPATPYTRIFTEAGWEVVSSPEDADLIQFVGGADVSPHLYGAPRHPTTRSRPDRDRKEQAVYEQYVGRVPMAGICRGAQFLWVMNGGKLNQHITGHRSEHAMFNYKTGEPLPDASSTHHQSMRCTPKDKRWANVLAVSEHNGVAGQTGQGVEVAVFKKTKSLCFQPHAEHRGNRLLTDYYMGLIWNYLVNKG